MIKMVFAFVILTGLIYSTIFAYQKMTKTRKFKLFKTIGVSVLCSSFAFLLLISIVVLF